MRAVFKRVGAWIDIADVTFFIGVGLMAYGLWLVFEPAAFIGTGALLVGMVLVPKFKGGGKEKK